MCVASIVGLLRNLVTRQWAVELWSVSQMNVVFGDYDQPWLKQMLTVKEKKVANCSPPSGIGGTAVRKPGEKKKIQPDWGVNAIEKLDQSQKVINESVYFLITPLTNTNLSQCVCVSNTGLPWCEDILKRF